MDEIPDDTRKLLFFFKCGIRMWLSETMYLLLGDV